MPVIHIGNQTPNLQPFGADVLMGTGSSTLTQTATFCCDGNVLYGDTTFTGSVTITGSTAVTGSTTVVGTTAVTSGTDGRVFFQAGGVVQQSDRFTFDNTTATNILQLGAGANLGVSLRTIAPGGTSGDIAFRVRNSADTANIVQINGDGSQAWLDPANNAFTTIRSGASTLIQWGNVNFLNTIIGLGAISTPSNYRNTIVGGGAQIGSTAGEAIKIGALGIASGQGNINIGYSANTNGNYAIKIGYHQGPSNFGGTNSIHLGRTTSGNDIAPDDVFMTYFNSQSSSTLTRANGSFGLLGQQAYIITNGTGALGLTTFMGNGGNTLVVRNHTSVPSTNITDSFQQYSADITTGNAAPHFRTENGAIVKVYQETTGVGAAALVTGVGTPLTDTDTFDGYTLKQIVKALRNQGLLA
jgi:hypothetical protein